MNIENWSGRTSGWFLFLVKKMGKKSKGEERVKERKKLRGKKSKDNNLYIIK